MELLSSYTTTAFIHNYCGFHIKMDGFSLTVMAVSGIVSWLADHFTSHVNMWLEASAQALIKSRIFFPRTPVY